MLKINTFDIEFFKEFRETKNKTLTSKTEFSMNRIAKTSLIVVTLSTIVFSCKKAEESQFSEEVSTTDAVSSSAAVVKDNSTHKFIRTTDLKFKVKNVPQSTYYIENIVNKFDGFVTYTNLQTNIIEQYQTKVSQDSTLESTKYNVENNITIRVPNKRLDTVIKCIAKQIDFLNYRIIKAGDVSLKMLANQLSQQRSANKEKRVEKAIDTKGKKINDIMDAENNLANQKEQKDAAKLENLSLQDQINFSTLTIQIYQSETFKQELIANTKDYNDYKPNLGFRIIDSLKTGWNFLLDIIVFLLQIWWFFIIGIAAWFLFKKYNSKE